MRVHARMCVCASVCACVRYCVCMCLPEIETTYVCAYLYPIVIYLFQTDGRIP